MELKELLKDVEITGICGGIDREIQGISYDSRKVEKGFLFAALRGREADGHGFVEEALRRGAAAILAEEARGPLPQTTIRVPNSRRALARVSANFYGNPSSRLSLIGITGTNGKTTTSFLLESILRKAGYRTGLIGTIQYRYGTEVVTASNTTPESLDLQKILHEMVEAGVTHVVMEVSSHGLDLDRVFGCQFDGALFTNLTQDHLDYHPTPEHYFESKKRLFSEALAESRKTGRFAVTNWDDPKGKEVVEGVPLPVFSYGSNRSCDLSADRIESTLDGLACRIHTPTGPFFVRSRLVGEFNVRNIMAAAAAGVAMGLPLDVLKAGIEALAGVPGRFERVENRRQVHVIVDFAHTPDALERALQGVKGLIPAYPCPSGRRGEAGGGLPSISENDRKIITVFGCGGDRDRKKRPLMGEVSGRYSDLSILTSDNPRTEDALDIIKEVERGFKNLSLDEWPPDQIGPWRRKRGYLKIADRREAIRRAIDLGRTGDIILIAGKGHEDYQIIGKKKFPFSDQIEARKALGET